MKRFKAVAGEGRHTVEIEAFSTDGRGICAFMTGGARPHNGGTVVANPRLKSNAQNENDRTADIWVSCVPGHKDTEIGVPVAKRIAVAINEAVSLTVGIHIDHAQKETIELLCDNCMEAAERLVEEYKKISG